MKKTIQTLTLSMTMLMAASGPAQALLYSFQQGVSGYTGQTDTFTEYQADWTYNWGGTVSLTIYNSGGAVASDPGGTGGTQFNPDNWQKMGLMRFDLSSIPTNFTVPSAQLTLKVAGAPSAAQTVTLRPILRGGLDFGTSNGATEAGTVSVLYSITSSTGWGAGDTNANPRLGYDYGAPFATATLNPGDTSVTFTVTAEVQNWVSNPAANLGFVIRSETVGSQFFFYSAEAATLADRPLLEIIPEPGTGGLLLLGAALIWRRQRSRTHSQTV